MLPTISLALITYAALSRFQRASMLEVINSDYVRLARAKGITPPTSADPAHAAYRADPDDDGHRADDGGVLRRHGDHRDGLQLAGTGRLHGQGDPAGDKYIVLAVLMLTGFIVIIGNLVADILYAVLDPRIRYA